MIGNDRAIALLGFSIFVIAAASAAPTAYRLLKKKGWLRRCGCGEDDEEVVGNREFTNNRGSVALFSSILEQACCCFWMCLYEKDDETSQRNVDQRLLFGDDAAGYGGAGGSTRSTAASSVRRGTNASSRRPTAASQYNTRGTGFSATGVDIDEEDDEDSLCLCTACCCRTRSQKARFSRISVGLLVFALLVWQVVSISYGSHYPQLSTFPNDAQPSNEKKDNTTTKDVLSCEALDGQEFGFFHPACEYNEPKVSFTLPPDEQKKINNNNSSSPSPTPSGAQDAFALFGYHNGKVSQKCCVSVNIIELGMCGVPPSSSGNHNNNNRKAFSAIPFIASDSPAYKNETIAQQYINCCPMLPGGVIPQGFGTIAISSVIGTLINVLLNFLQFLRDRHCPWFSFTRCWQAWHRMWNSSGKRRKKMYGDAAEMGDNGGGDGNYVDRTDRQQLEEFGGVLPLYVRLFGISTLQVYKTVLFVFVGFVVACYTAGESGSSGNAAEPAYRSPTNKGAWGGYIDFYTILMNGSTTQNAIDFIASIIVSEVFLELMYQYASMGAGVIGGRIRRGGGGGGARMTDGEAGFAAVGQYLFSTTNEHAWQHAHDEIFAGSNLSIIVGLLCTMVYLLPALTHWIGGVLIFFVPVMVLILGFALLGALVIAAIYFPAKKLHMWNGVSLTIVLLILTITINFCLAILTRFPFNLALMAGGATSYNRFNIENEYSASAASATLPRSGDGATIISSSMFFGAAWLDSVFYLIEMGSQDCYFLRLYTSFYHGMDIILAFL